MTTAERVVNILVEKGHYRVLSRPVRIGSQEFAFTSMLAGTNKANDLVLVIELTASTGDDNVIRSVLAFTRALDVIGSRRPVTVVLTSGQADKNLVNAINRVCRVLPIGSPTGEDSGQVIAEWLAALLPLESPPAVEHLGEWRGALEEALMGLDSSEIDKFVSLALDGKEAVEDALAVEINLRAEKVLDEDEGQVDA